MDFAWRRREVYPGLGLPLRHIPEKGAQCYPVDLRSDIPGSWSQLLPVREVAMMFIMDRLTDKSDWHRKVFDDEIVSNWRKEALDYPAEILWHEATRGKRSPRGSNSLPDSQSPASAATGIVTTEMFDYCIQELKNKAQYYRITGIVPTLDGTAGVVKSDTIINPKFRAFLQQAFKKVRADQSGCPDWYPGTHEKVLNLVHPSMFPLLYGHTRGFRQELVGVEDAIRKRACEGDVLSCDLKEEPLAGPNEGGEPPEAFWSPKYQWLPTNFEILGNGSVSITSYINNLHPIKYAPIYKMIEKLVSKVLPLWDQCLYRMENETRIGAGRHQSRFPPPIDADDRNGQNWIPSSPQAMAGAEPDWAKWNIDPKNEYRDALLHREWRKVRQAVHLSPGRFEEIDYTPNERLIDIYQTKGLGLQIIVKMTSIELTPEKPEYPAGSWHVEGQMNERICATALYYVDCENVTTSSLSFRMQTSPSTRYSAPYQVGQDSYRWLEAVYGTYLGESAPCLQNYGSVETPESRLLAFPNVFQHSVSPFKLKDPTKPGHRRFIALWLVDPYQPIISTANVPPQQPDWWLESVLNKTPDERDAALKQLPPEIIAILEREGLLSDSDEDKRKIRFNSDIWDKIDRHLPGSEFPMSYSEARKHREELMKERTRFAADVQTGWQQHTYNFCEH